MAERRLTEEQKVLVAHGHDHRRLAAGTLAIDVDHMTWAEKCRPRCKHADGICHMARSGLYDWRAFDEAWPTPSAPSEETDR